MRYDQGDPAELKQRFWEELGRSPFLMLQLDADEDSAAPMTAQLDKEAHGEVWFFTTRDNRFAALGPATATFVGKDHKLYARISGTLKEETSRERLDALWSNMVQAWFPEGKDDPNLLLMRMELGEASIWAGELGALNTARMLLGLNVRDAIKGGYAEVAL